MNRDDVIRLAREAGMEVHDRKGQVRIGSAILTGGDSTEQVERFAQLVAAHERERCIDAAWQQERYGGGKEYKVGLQMAVNAIRARGTA